MVTTPRGAHSWHPRRLRDLLRVAIADRQELDGRIPSESELMAEFGASRTAVREGLSILVNEGQIERRRGQGTSRIASYVRFDQTIPHTEPQRRIYDEIISRMAPEIIHSGWTPVPPPIVRRLSGAAAGDQCLAVEYVFRLDGIPLAVITNYLRRTEAEKLEGRALRSDYYSHLRDAGIEIENQASFYQARHADRLTAEILNIGEGDPVLAFEQEIDDASGDVINVAFGTIHSDVRITSGLLPERRSGRS
jgi:GntR family transcriptional regulator